MEGKQPSWSSNAETGRQWYFRKHSNIDWGVTQFLTGPECFGNYLYKIEKREENTFLDCHDKEDSPEHTWNDCPLWEDERIRLRRVLEKEAKYWTVMPMVLENVHSWEAIATTMNAIIMKKRFVSPIHQQSFSCRLLSETQQSPFVVLLLYNSSGRFLGMGGILDKTTVITSASAIKIAKGNVGDILVLAGYLSPWWGENAQVRHAHTTHVSEYEVALVEIKPKLIFTKRIRPLPLVTLSRDDKEYTLYGISMDKSSESGQFLVKTAVYYPDNHPSTSLNNCITTFSNVPELTHKTHLCLLVNNSFCKGSLGSPVTRIQRNSLNPYFLGVIIRSECASQKMLMVKLTTFVDWITYINTNRKL